MHIDDFFIKIKTPMQKKELGVTLGRVSTFTKISKIIKSSFLESHFLIACRMIRQGDLTTSQRAALTKQLDLKIANNFFKDDILKSSVRKTKFGEKI